MVRKSAAAVAEEPLEAVETDEEAPRSIFEEISVRTKAGDFKFRELDGDAYDDAVELARDSESKRVDMVQLLRWLAIESSVDGKADAKKLNKLPYRVRNKILAEVNELYFPDETSELVDRLESLGYTVTSPEGTDSPNS